MTHHKRPMLTAAVLVAPALALAACGGGGTAATTTGASTTVPTSSPGASTTTTGPAGTTTTVPGGARNLTVTDGLRADLLAAGAAHNSLPVADYTGLRPGLTYYAFDPATDTYWAGAALDPSPTSTPAQVSVQDDGGYLLFHEPSGGAWVVDSVGEAGVADGGPCPVVPPAGVLAVWGWPAGTCHAPGT